MKEGNSLRLQRIRARQGCTLFDTSSCSKRRRGRLSDVKLSLQDKVAFFDTSSCSCKTKMHSLGYFKVFPNEERESMTSRCSRKKRGSLSDFNVFEQGKVAFFDASSCSSTKEENSLILQAVRAIQRREFFETSSCSSNKEGNSL